MAKRAAEYPIVRITKDELKKLVSQGWHSAFYELKQLSAMRGLIYSFPKRTSKTDIRFKTWFDEEGNLCQQNYAVDLTIDTTKTERK